MPQLLTCRLWDLLSMDVHLNIADHLLSVSPNDN
jgi:hypothetical protein